MPGIPIEHTKKALEAVNVPVTVTTPAPHRRILIERTELVQAAFNRLVSEAETHE